MKQVKQVQIIYYPIIFFNAIDLYFLIKTNKNVDCFKNYFSWTF